MLNAPRITASQHALSWQMPSVPKWEVAEARIQFQMRKNWGLCLGFSKFFPQSSCPLKVSSLPLPPPTTPGHDDVKSDPVLIPVSSDFFLGVSSFLSLLGSRGLNSGGQASQQASWPAEPSFCPSKYLFRSCLVPRENLHSILGWQALNGLYGDTLSRLV